MKLKILACFIILGVVGKMDCDDAELQQRIYCERVQSGIWPDFKGLFNDVCLTTD